MNILIVDDELEIKALIGDIIRGEFAKVSLKFTANGDQAFDLFKKKIIHFVKSCKDLRNENFKNIG